MFDVGATELFMLALIGLLVLGPERLPAVARTLGGFVRKARLSYNNLKRTVEAELAAADAANPIKQARDELETVQQQVADLGKQLDEPLDTPTIAPPEDTHPLNPEVDATLAGPEAEPETTPEAGPKSDPKSGPKADPEKPEEGPGRASP
jgi:sec-independent protein translocase protein TatB